MHSEASHRGESRKLSVDDRIVAVIVVVVPLPYYHDAAEIVVITPYAETYGKPIPMTTL